MEQMITELLNYGSLGLFAVFLVWQYIEQKRQLREMLTGFQTKLDEMRDQSDTREGKLRKRYDDVIASITKEKSEIQMSLLTKVSELEKSVEAVDRKVENLSLVITDLREKILKLEFKEITNKGPNQNGC